VGTGSELSDRFAGELGAQTGPCTGEYITTRRGVDSTEDPDDVDDPWPDDSVDDSDELENDLRGLLDSVPALHTCCGGAMGVGTYIGTESDSTGSATSCTVVLVAATFYFLVIVVW
jgi:hypothetical protein